MLPASGDMRNVEAGRDTPPHIGRTMSENHSVFVRRTSRRE
jgi:hypothetical protein